MLSLQREKINIFKLSIASSITMIIVSILIILFFKMIDTHLIPLNRVFWGILFIFIIGTYGLYYSLFFQLFYHFKIVE